MSDQTQETSAAAPSSNRAFLLVTISGSLVAWDIGFELGAFDTVSYRRVFTVFVVSTVVLLTTVVANDETFATSPLSRSILSLPLVYLLADVTFLTVSDRLVDLLNVLLLITFPYALWVLAKLLDRDFFALPSRERLIALFAVIAIGCAGLYIGNANDRFLTCSDFERIGDYQPDGCTP